LIWCSYRKNFEKPLLSDPYSIRYLDLCENLEHPQGVRSHQKNTMVSGKNPLTEKYQKG